MPTAVASAPAPHVFITVSDRIGFSDSATVTIREDNFVLSVAMLRWLLTPEGQAVAAWLGVALGIASIAFTLSD